MICECFECTCAQESEHKSTIDKFAKGIEKEVQKVEWSTRGSALHLFVQALSLWVGFVVVAGVNWGTVDFQGPHLTMMIDEKPSFEVSTARPVFNRCDLNGSA